MDVTVEQILASEHPFSLDAEHDGSCPCASIQGEGFTVRIHCWRAGCDDCKWSGVHVVGLNEETGRRVAEHICDNNGWSNHTAWNVVIEG